MQNFALFTDVSLNPRRQLGVGAYLLVSTSFLDREPDQIERAEVTARLRYRRFTETSSTKLEIQTVLWGLGDYLEESNAADLGPLQVYTDSQCVAGLLERKTGLEANSFIARRSAQPLRNATLYRSFYAAYDELEFALYKVAGHSRASSHDTVQRVFAYVDQEVRRALSTWLAESVTLT